MYTYICLFVCWNRILLFVCWSCPIKKKKKQKVDNATFFMQPVDTNKMPQYLLIIKHPMDLGSVKVCFFFVITGPTRSVCHCVVCVSMCVCFIHLFIYFSFFWISIASVHSVCVCAKHLTIFFWGAGKKK